MISIKSADEVLYSHMLKAVLEDIEKIAKDAKNKNVCKEIQNFLNTMNNKIM